LSSPFDFTNLKSLKLDCPGFKTVGLSPPPQAFYLDKDARIIILVTVTLYPIYKNTVEFRTYGLFFDAFLIVSFFLLP